MIIKADTILEVKRQAEERLGITEANRVAPEEVRYVKIRQLLSDPQIFEIIANKGGVETRYSYRPEGDVIDLPPVSEWG